MALGMTRPWKHPKTGMYWLRRRVPDDLLEVLGKTEVKKSLHTKNPVEAKALLVKALADLDAQWGNLRKGPTTLTDTEAHQLATAVFQQWFDRFKDNPSDQRSWNVEIGPSAVWTLPNDTVPAHLIAAHEHMYGMRPYLQHWADELLASAGLTVDEKSKDRLARAISAAIHRASLALKRIELGEPVALPNQFLLASPGTAQAPSKSVKLKQLVDEWVLERKPARKTIYEWSRVLGELELFLGHGDAAQISTSDLNRWKSHLLSQGRRPKTIRDAKIAPVRAILQCAVANERIASNPAERVVIEVRTKPSERIRGYTDEESKKILSAARQQGNPVLRWVPWLSAFTGARVAETCQLRREDIFSIEGIECLRITSEAGPLKTASSERIVPLHSALVREGFVDFVRKRPAGALFKELSPDKFGSRGGNGTKMLGRWVRSMGITDPRISPNHSWRHRMKTLMRVHDVRPDVGDALVGHRRRTVGDAYGDFPVAALKRELEKIPGLRMDQAT